MSTNIYQRTQSYLSVERIRWLSQIFITVWTLLLMLIVGLEAKIYGERFISWIYSKEFLPQLNLLLYIITFIPSLPFFFLRLYYFPVPSVGFSRGTRFRPC